MHKRNQHEADNGVWEPTNSAEGHYKAIIDSSEDAIISKDLNGIIQTWNQGAEKVFGYAAEEVIGKSVTILIPPENHNEEEEILNRIRAGERIEHYETVRRRKDGQLINISLTVSPIKNIKGEIVGASKIARNITDKKRWEGQLQHAHEELERANRAKDQFLAVLSHELRTPLNPVLLVASDAAVDSKLPPEVRSQFETIVHNVEIEARMIDDLLDLARITTGKFKLEKREVKVHEILLNSISTIKSLARQKEIGLREQLDCPECVVLGDPVRLLQVFSNILKNAVKFTPPKGTISVQARSGDEYIVDVSDNGIGMTPEELTVVFEPFRQGDHSQGAHRFDGLGLGLAISKQFVEFHSGKIEASSKGRHCGSTFTISLPVINGTGGQRRNNATT